MGKLDKLARESGGNANESLGTTRQRTDPPAAAAQGPADARQQGIRRAKDVFLIEVGRIVPDPDQPREEFEPESLQRLAASMQSKGQLQPVCVRWDGGQGAYVMIAGERRWQAAKLAGLPTVAATIHEGSLTRGQLRSLQVIENCLREDLRPIEQARAFRDLMEENGWSARQVAEELSLSPGGVAQALRMLTLPDQVQDQVEQGALSPAAAYEMSKLQDPQEQVALAEQVVAGGLRRDDLREEVKRRSGRPSGLRVEIHRGNCKITSTVTGPASEAEGWAEKLRRLE